MKKRILALVLAIVLTASLLPVTAAAAAPTPDTSWYGDGSATTFTLTDAADLLGLATLVNNGTSNFAGKTVKLGANIDLGGIDWTPISSFAGTFDGGSKTIYNLKMDASKTHKLGLFSTLSAGTIQNLTLDTVTVTANRAIYFGSIVRYASTGSTLLNCHVKNVTVTISGTTGVSVNNPIGGLAGCVYDASKVENCSVENFTLVANNTCYDGVGGLIGQFFIGSAKTDQYSGSLKNCHVAGFTAQIAELAGHQSGGTGNGGNFGGVGGMLGYGHSGNDSYDFPIENCTVTGLNINVGKMYNHSFIGGFVGMSRRRYRATDCSASGTITAGSAEGCTMCYVGGFCGAPTGADTTETDKWKSGYEKSSG